MSTENRHINFEVMKQYILDHQDGNATPTNGGKQYWRSLEELADSAVLREFVTREFPQQAQEWDDPIQRRSFLKLMGASLALAGLSGCVYQPPEKIVPYVKQPEDVVPGKSLFFATAFSLGGVAVPLLARANEGRPTKLEGNPDHPNNRSGENDTGSSATDIFSQASILTLYDPDRSQTTLYRDETRPWTTFVGELRTLLDEQRGKQGSGIRFLTETITSPTVAAQIREISTEFPQAKWHSYEPVNDDNARAGALTAFGQPVNTIYNFGAAERVLAIDSDFLACGPGSLRYAREFAAKRRGGEHGEGINRLYCISSSPTTTGAKADHCWNLRPSEIEAAARAIAQQLGANAAASTSTSGTNLEFVGALVKDLKAHSGASIVIAGREASPAVHALAHAMNASLGNVGKTVFYTDPLDASQTTQRESLQDLINDIDAGRVELLVIVGGNPVYNTPADLRLDQQRMFKVKTRIHLSMYRDETSELCHWHIPETHYLETWSDARSYDGTASIVQPLIEPLYQSKSIHEFLAAFTQQYDRKSYDIVKAFWQSRGQNPGAGAGVEAAQAATPAAIPSATPQARPAGTPGADFESSWRKWVHDGFIPNTALPVKTFAASTATTNSIQASTPAQTSAGNFEIVFRADPTIYDGRFANNGWLQELPKPLTKITWDNAALVSPNTAQQLGLTQKIGEMGGDIYVDTLKIIYQARTLNSVPAWITPGQPDGVITLHLGYGRWLPGRVGKDHGVNAYAIRSADSPWFGVGAQVSKDAARHQLAATQLHFNMLGRDIVRSHNVGEEAHQEEGKHSEPPPEETLYDPSLYDYKKQGMGYAWGMAIDLNNCVGCSGCTIACQAENNIPVVGKQEVARSREMHWIRVDTYFEGNNASHPENTHFMPVPCMHCENAPCEPVCPVHATVHSAEGLNDMVYNRCVGTKYCSNNCPYKVRRFNFYLYQDWDTPTYQLMRNPDVTVRSRGGVGKCTY
jgi:molybdopterin-containing oxidoreductase family iron-sulfur binding subunit